MGTQGRHTTYARFLKKQQQQISHGMKLKAKKQETLGTFVLHPFFIFGVPHDGKAFIPTTNFRKNANTNSLFH
jgi:hypothetical protein